MSKSMATAKFTGAGRRPVLLVLACATLLTSACQRNDDEGEARQAQAPAATSGDTATKAVAKPDATSADLGAAKLADTTPKPPASPPSEPTLTLTNPGAEPRSQLRYAFPEKLSQKLRLRMSLSSAMSRGGKPGRNITRPPFVFDIALSDSERLADGSVKAHFTFGDASIEGGTPAEQDMLRKQIERIEGLAAWVVFDSSGQPRESKLDVPELFAASLQDQIQLVDRTLRQLTVPFPQEAVGVGAEWTVTSVVVSQGAQVQQTIGYKLVRLDGTSGSVELSFTQNAADQPFELGGVKPGTKVRLVTMQAKGRGLAEFDLGTLISPSTNEAEMLTEIEVSGANGQKGPVQMSSSFRVEVGVAE